MLAQGETVNRQRPVLIAALWITACALLPLHVLAAQQDPVGRYPATETPPEPSNAHEATAREKALSDFIVQLLSNADRNEPQPDHRELVESAFRQAVQAAAGDSSLSEGDRAMLLKRLEELREAHAEAYPAIGTPKIIPGSVLKIQVAGTPPAQAINGMFLVESDGQLSLGATYGRVQLTGKTFIEAEQIIAEHLGRILKSPRVLVRAPIEGFEGPTRVALPASPYQIEAGEVLYVQLAGIPSDQPTETYVQVEPAGTIAVGPFCGRVPVAGLSLSEAEQAIRAALKPILQRPGVSVTHGHWRLVLSRGGFDSRVVDSGADMQIQRNPFGQRDAAPENLP